MLQILGFTTEEVAVFIAVLGVLSVIAQVSITSLYSGQCITRVVSLTPEADWYFADLTYYNWRKAIHLSGHKELIHCVYSYYCEVLSPFLPQRL